MGSHAIPRYPVTRAPALSPNAEGRRLRRDRSRAEGLPGGSISFEFHPPIRRQGADLDSGSVPPGAGEGRLRRRLRLSVARRAGARLRRQRVDRRDRLTAANDAALFAGARRLCNGAFGHERGLAPRLGGPGLLRGTAQDGVGARPRGGVRRAGAQVPDLGARRAFRPISSRRGSASGACARSATRKRRRGLRDEPRRARWARPCSGPARGGDGGARCLAQAALYVDGTFGGGGYSRALLERWRPRDRLRSRPIGHSRRRSARCFVRRPA